MRKLMLLLLLMTALRVSAQNMDGNWVGKLRVGQSEVTLLFNIATDKQEVSVVIPNLSDDTLSLPVDTLIADSISVRIPPLMARYCGKRVDNTVKGLFAQGAFFASMTLLREANSINRPQEPKQPYAYQTEEVKFTDAKDTVTLAGTLTYPVGFKRGRKVPVVLMVSGSGAQNRDELMAYHKPFLVLADWLARHGIASLRYDDRGMYGSTGSFPTATTINFANDAEAGIDYLRQRADFSRVGLMGHSEGGAIGYILASEGKLDFLVSLAGPAGRMDSLLMEQLNELTFAQSGVKDYFKTIEQTRNYVLSKGDTPWMRFFLDLDLRPYVRKTRCPVFAAGGTMDGNVPVSYNVPVLKANLPANKKNVVKVYEGLNHLFQHAKTKNPVEYFNIEETFSEEVMKDISDWIYNR